MDYTNLDKFIEITDEIERLRNEKNEARKKSLADPKNQELYDDYEEKNNKYLKYFNDNKHLISAKPIK